MNFIKPKISFCSTVMNRYGQLIQTLEKNLEAINRYGGEVELTLVNFIKDDEGVRIHDFLMQFESASHFNYFVSCDLKYWHAPKAKNTAHIASYGDFLVNLDCDNFLDEQGIDLLLRLPESELKKALFLGYSGEIILKKRIRWHKALRRQYKFIDALKSNDGSYGHIGMHKDMFFAIGGYDQNLPAMAGSRF